MKTVTKEYKVFKFDELSDTAKDKAIEKYNENDDYPFLEDDINYQFGEIDSYFTDTEIQYSLSSCQGDGLSFSGEFNLRKFLTDRYTDKLSKMRINAICEMIYRVFSVGNEGHYCFALKGHVDYDLNYTDKDFPTLEKLWYGVLEDIRVYYLDICKNLEKYGYEIVEHIYTHDEFTDLCESNDYEFLENGTMY